MKIFATIIALVLGIVGSALAYVWFFRGNVEKLHGASALALAGEAPRGDELALHKNLAPFMEPAVDSFSREARPVVRRRTESGSALTWVPSRGEIRRPEEIAQRPWAGVLTAKEQNDAAEYEAWLRLLRGEEGAGAAFGMVAEMWGFSSEGRIALTVRDVTGRAAVDLPVTLEQGGRVVARARTDNLGRVGLFPPPGVQGPFQVRIGAQTVVQRRAGSVGVTTLAGAAPAPAAVGDVMVVMDTTGSMKDELRYLQSELENVITRAEDRLVQRVRLRASVNFYRDRGDEYVVRSFPFTDELGDVQSALLAQKADGGGDRPEAVDVALADAIEGHAWSPSARGRLLFLVLDAPPHSGRSVRASLRRSLARAAELGVRIVPVAGSGIDKPTEALLRHFAVLSGGRYVYLTDESGVGGRHLEATGSRAQTERLNDLLTRVIVETMRLEDERAPVDLARR